MSANASMCDRWAANESMILDFNSLMRTAIFANVHRGSTSREAIDYAVGFVEFLPDL
jgi:hypothetical protein